MVVGVIVVPIHTKVKKENNSSFIISVFADNFEEVNYTAGQNWLRAALEGQKVSL